MSKDIEDKGYLYLESYVTRNLPGAKLRKTMNKGRGANDDVADAVLDYNGHTFPIELKVRSGAIGTNIRFAHQTISNAHGEDLIVALIWNLDNPEPTEMAFFRLGEVQLSLSVEPHFIVQSKNLKGRCDKNLENVLGRAANPLELKVLLDSKIESWMVGSKAKAER